MKPSTPYPFTSAPIGAAFIAAALVSAWLIPAALGDDYHFIVSGDPEAAATVGTSTAVTSGSALDAVFNSVRTTPGGALTSKIGAMLLLLR